MRRRTIGNAIAKCRTDFGAEITLDLNPLIPRALQPLSGVCPLLPILLLLLAWYLWAVCQTARLRFSAFHRPRIASVLPAAVPWTPQRVPYPLFVPEEAPFRILQPGLQMMK